MGIALEHAHDQRAGLYPRIYVRAIASGARDRPQRANCVVCLIHSRVSARGVQERAARTARLILGRVAGGQRGHGPAFGQHPASATLGRKEALPRLSWGPGLLGTTGGVGEADPKSEGGRPSYATRCT